MGAPCLVGQVGGAWLARQCPHPHKGPTFQWAPPSLVPLGPCYCKHIKWEWDQVELVLPGHQPKDVTTHRWSQLPFYPLPLHLVSSEQRLLLCDCDAKWTCKWRENIEFGLLSKLQFISSLPHPGWTHGHLTNDPATVWGRPEDWPV